MLTVCRFTLSEIVSTHAVTREATTATAGQPENRHTTPHTVKRKGGSTTGGGRTRTRPPST